MNRRRCCFLSMDSLDGYVSDDDLAVAPLADLGWAVTTVSWRDESVDWNYFDVVVIRTTWDYQRDPGRFLSVLESIERSAARLENALNIVKWNLSKEYLRDLEIRGVPVVSTIWPVSYSEADFERWLQHFKAEEIIVKPIVSATAEDTYRLRQYDRSLKDVFADRAFMVQPFMPAIVSEGEYSLFYFNGEFSHAILKQPKPHDFRVQEEHGGNILAVEADARLLEAGTRAVEQIRPVPLYARVDLVRDDVDNFLIMELELIEPALYFRMDPGAPARFAAALNTRMA